MANQTVTVSVLADTKPLSRSFGGLGDKLGLGKLGRGVGQLGAALAKATAVGGAALVGLGAFSTRAASDLEQSVGAVDAVFKGNADTIHTWAKGAAKDLGLTQHSYNELATVIGTQLKNSGVPMAELSGQTDDLITRSADLAAMFGGPVTESSQAMAAALRGEYEPLRRYGVSLSAAEIESRALADTGKSLAGELTKQEKALATQAIIMEQSADAAGQFARESDTLAGRSERLRAQLGNLATSIGTLLLPAVSAVVGWLSDNLQPAVETLSTWAKANLLPVLIQLGEVMSGTVLPALQAIGSYVMATVVPAIQQLWDRVTGLAGDRGAGLLTQGLHQLQGVLGTVGGIVGQLVPTVVGLATALAARVGPAVQTIAQAIVGQLLPAVNQFWQLVGPVLVPVLQTAAEALKFLAGILIDTVVGAVTGVIQAFQGLVGMIQGAVDFFSALVAGDWSAAWAALKNIGKSALDFIVGVVKTALNVGVLGLFRKALSALRALWSGGFNAISATATSVMGSIRSFLGSVLGSIRSAFTTALNVIVGLFRKALSALSALWSGGLGAIRSTATSVMGSIHSFLGSVLGSIRSAFTTALNAIRSAVSTTFSAIRSIIRTISSGIRSTISGDWNGIHSTMVSILSGMRNAMESAWNAMWGIVTRAMSRIGSAISNGISTFMIYIQGIPGRILGALGSLGNLLYGAGRSLIQGLVNGLWSMASWLGSQISSLVSRYVPGPIKKLLGIASPSKVFAEIGRNTMRGLQVGIKDQAKDVLRDVTRIGGKLADTPMSLTAALNPAPNSYSTSGGNTYQITVQTLTPTPETGRVIVDAIRDYERIGGPVMAR